MTYSGTGSQSVDQRHDSLVAATSIICNATYRVCVTILTPIFTSLFLRLVSDQCAFASGIASVREKLAGGWRRIDLRTHPGNAGLSPFTSRHFNLRAPTDTLHPGAEGHKIFQVPSGCRQLSST